MCVSDSWALFSGCSSITRREKLFDVFLICIGVLGAVIATTDALSRMASAPEQPSAPSADGPVVAIDSAVTPAAALMAAVANGSAQMALAPLTNATTASLGLAPLTNATTARLGLAPLTNVTAGSLGLATLANATATPLDTS